MPLVVAADAHTLRERPHLTAVQVIQHFNWVWANPLEYTQFQYEDDLCPFFLPESGACLLTPTKANPGVRSEFYIAFDF